MKTIDGVLEEFVSYIREQLLSELVGEVGLSPTVVEEELDKLLPVLLSSFKKRTEGLSIEAVEVIRDEAKSMLVAVLYTSLFLALKEVK